MPRGVILSAQKGQAQTFVLRRSAAFGLGSSAALCVLLPSYALYLLLQALLLITLNAHPACCADAVATLP